MLRANIYRLEPLLPDMREAVLGGVDMLASYIGERIVSKEYDIRMPLTDRGLVEPGRLPLSYLDQEVELHMLAVPLEVDRESTAMGYAYIGTGFAYVDTSRYTPDSTRATSAHETAHALGFVTPWSRHEDPNSQFHCCTADCLMHKHEVQSAYWKEAPMGDLQDELNRMLRTSSIRRPMVAVRAGQKDFCKPCKIDMTHNGARNVENLRRNRPTNWAGVV